MLVGHNFDSIAGYQRSLERGIERLGSPTWKFLLEYIGEAEVAPEDCFFTNGLMGLQRTSARGKLRCSAEFRYECARFLAWQIKFVAPRLIVVLGSDAERAFGDVASDPPAITLRHPMSLIYVKKDARRALVMQQAGSMRSALRALSMG
jgi:hypothetical protein